MIDVIIRAYICGCWAGIGLFMLKYHDLIKYRADFATEEWDHDTSVSMVIRNALVYVGLSWYGVYLFIHKEG